MSARIGPKVSLNLPPEVLTNIDTYAQAAGMERAAVIRQTLTALFGEEKRYARPDAQQLDRP